MKQILSYFCTRESVARADQSFISKRFSSIAVILCLVSVSNVFAMMSREQATPASVESVACPATFYEQYVHNITDFGIISVPLLQYSIFLMHAMSETDKADYLYTRLIAARELTRSSYDRQNYLLYCPAELEHEALCQVVNNKIVMAYEELENNPSVLFLIDPSICGVYQGYCDWHLIASKFYQVESIGSHIWSKLNDGEFQNQVLRTDITATSYVNARECLIAASLGNDLKYVALNWLAQRAWRDIMHNLHLPGYQAIELLNLVIRENITDGARQQICNLISVRRYFEAFWRAITKPDFNMSADFETARYNSEIAGFIETYEKGRRACDASRVHLVNDSFALLEMWMRETEQRKAVVVRGAGSTLADVTVNFTGSSKMNADVVRTTPVFHRYDSCDFSNSSQ